MNSVKCSFCIALCILQMFLCRHFGLIEMLIQNSLIPNRSLYLVASPLIVNYVRYYIIF
jgi:hypothetical protein